MHSSGFAAPAESQPAAVTPLTTARLTVGTVRTGNYIPTTGYPDGSGYTHYKWRLDTNAWSAETPISAPITLSNLPEGPHHVEIVGKNDAAFYQDDPAFGSNAVVSVSKTWTVQTVHPAFEITSVDRTGGQTVLHFPVLSGYSYSVQFNNSMDIASPWSNLTNLPVQAASGDMSVTDSAQGPETRFYRVVTPAQP